MYRKKRTVPFTVHCTGHTVKCTDRSPYSAQACTKYIRGKAETRSQNKPGLNICCLAEWKKLLLYQAAQHHTRSWVSAVWRKMCMVGQNCIYIYTLFMTTCSIKSLHKIPYVHRTHMVLVNPMHVHSTSYEVESTEQNQMHPTLKSIAGAYFQANTVLWTQKVCAFYIMDAKSGVCLLQYLIRWVSSTARKAHQDGDTVRKLS